ncbi:hypothetical protein ACJ73_06520 [Blastomyces percursus]|uniref:Uncharacterized protein n=1 Tax=Blastomyces percursus TaxID=1658174 RepID=A0A1J9Q0U0_9EURO|nr:hypothetical protein ACJ73_06520 [Blastomyces percursus]
MPSRLSSPVLSVDAAKIHEVDTRNAESLHGMWMVFSKCADYMEEGRRLENLSWRLWTRETFCVEPPLAAIPPLETRRLRCEPREIPELSSSVESAASDEGDRIERHINTSRTPDVKPAILDESALSISRGKEKHITSLGLERMVYNIKEKKHLGPLSLPTPTPQPTATATTKAAALAPVDITPRASSPTPTRALMQSHPVHPHQSSDSCSTTALDGIESDRAQVGSDTSVSSSGLLESSSVVRGFSPSHISSSYRSHPKISSPTSSKTTVTQKCSPLTKKGGMFTLGGSSGDDESSFEDRMTAQPQQPTQQSQQPRQPHQQRSSLSDGLHQVANTMQKMTMLKNSISSRTPIRPITEGSEDEDAIETDDDEEISESAIEDDDDSSDWEDSVTESGRSSIDEKELFQRVDSRPNLVSRRSLLTMMMHQPQRMKSPIVSKSGGPPGSRSTPVLQRSRLSSPTRDSAAASPDSDENTLTMKGPDMPRSKPIVVKSIPTYQHQIPHSPRTTRRNMLATELTESLRRHLLWERQQKTTTLTAGFKRRHTAHDMANLQEYPGPAGTKLNGQKQTQTQTQTQTQAQNAAADKEASKNNSWNHYFDYGPYEYHVKGW